MTRLVLLETALSVKANKAFGVVKSIITSATSNAFSLFVAVVAGRAELHLRRHPCQAGAVAAAGVFGTRQVCIPLQQQRTGYFDGA